MKKNLFEIREIIKDYESQCITVLLKMNPYVRDIVLIDFDEFKIWLDKQDRLYYETHDCSTGQYVSKSHNMSIYQYLDEILPEYFNEDIYEYIHDTCVDWSKAANTILFDTNKLLNNYKNYLS